MSDVIDSQCAIVHRFDELFTRLDACFSIPDEKKVGVIIVLLKYAQDAGINGKEILD